MSTATQVTDFSDLYSDLISRVREASGVTATTNVAKRYINIALHDMHINPGNYVSWAHRRSMLFTHAVYSTGTVSIALATRTTVAGSSTLWNTAETGYSRNNTRVGGKMTFAGAPNVYTVSVVSSDILITLEQFFIGETALSGATYTYFEDEFSLPADYFRPVDFRIFSAAMEIPLIGQAEFRRRYPVNSATGQPAIATMIQLGFTSSTAPRYRVVLHPPPDKVYNIPYSYITSNLAMNSSGTEQAQLIEDSDEPIVPLRFRHAIVYHALYHWYRDQKDDPRSAEAKAEYTDLMIRIAGDTAIGEDRPRFSPRVQPYYAQTAGWRGSRRQRYSIDTRFDELRDR